MTGPALRGPAVRPCGSCPYRQDVPGGVWAAEEYERLPAYDADTAGQPPRVFGCHRQDGRVCAGWAGCHDMSQSLGLRLAVALDRISVEDARAVLEYVSPVALWPSGRAAAEHGLAPAGCLSPAAARIVDRLQVRRAEREAMA